MPPSTASGEPQPQPAAMIWRYVDLPKLLSLLERGTLYFACIDRLEDPFEGSFTQIDYSAYEKWLWEEGGDSGVPAGFWIEQMKEIAVDERRYTFCNCWHLSNSESAAMWKLYSDLGRGFAIQSTVGRLRKCLPKHVHIEPVEYVDFATESARRSRFLTKRLEFNHERELRALFARQGLHGKAGVEVPVRLDVLIERLIVAPFTPKWIKSLVPKIVARYDLNILVEASVLESQPLHPLG